MEHDRTEPSESGVEIAPGLRVPEAVLRFSYAAASGPGGQNVNKRATKAVLRITIEDIPLRGRALDRVRRLGSGWLAAEGSELLIMADEHRSQRRNREACLERLRALLVRAMVPPKPRIATRPGRGAIERRLREKREQSQKKNRRREGPEE